MAKLGAAVLFLAVVSVQAQKLKPTAVTGWDAYIVHAESQMGADLKATDSERTTVSSGGVYIRHVEMPGAKLDGALIHHWLGGIFLPGAKIKPLQVWMKDYDAHSKYFAEIERSKLLSHEGNTFKIYYRFKRKKIITVYYNTEHTVVYQPIEGNRTTSKSVATRIAEIDNPGAKDEREKTIGDDSGFLWRLNSYWRFQETPSGVFLECESISLSRGIPTGLAWMIRGFVESVPRESLESTLTSIRKGFKPE